MGRQLNLIALVLFACSMFVRSTDPVIPQIAGDLAVDPATVALLATAFTLPYALVQPVFGALADMFSKARMMLICLFAGTVATFVCGFATNFEVLVVARMVAGLATGGVMPIAFALVGDKFRSRSGRWRWAGCCWRSCPATCSARPLPASSATCSAGAACSSSPAPSP